MHQMIFIARKALRHTCGVVVLVCLAGAGSVMAQKTAEIKSPERKAPAKSETPAAEPDKAERKSLAEKEPGEKKTETKPDPISEFEKQLQRELEGGSAPGDRKEAERPSWLWQFTKTTFALLVMLGFFFLVYRVWLFKKNLPKANKSALKVLYEYPLMPGKYLQIVDLSDRLLVLGISDSSVNLVTEISDRVSVDRIRLECERDNIQPGADFLTELTKVIKTRITAGKPGIKNFQQELDADDNAWSGSRESSLNRLKQIREQKNRLRDDQI